MASTIQLPYDADLNGLSQTLMSARNDLIFIMGFAMGQAREFFGVNPTLTGINGRKFADACTSFLLLKFQSQQFQFLEGGARVRACLCACVQCTCKWFGFIVEVFWHHVLC
eukprot:m.119156 g.119156  ORF g.119156 m.119156 type:complete len:111 (+) comp13674_c3_seq1:142-474(+)